VQVVHAHGAPLPAANDSERDRSGILDVGAHRCINATANLKQGVSIRLMSAAVIYGASESSIKENPITRVRAAYDSDAQYQFFGCFGSLMHDPARMTRTGT
jgi:hypothetical protein